MGDLVSAQELHRRTGYSVRFFQDLAAKGKIAWARQPNPRGRWFFDLDGFEAWWKADRQKPKEGTWRRSTKGAAVGGGARSKGKGVSIDDPSRLRMKQKLDESSASGGENSTAPPSGGAAVISLYERQ